MSQVLVKKFGGSSVGTTQRIDAVAERVLRDLRRGGQHPVLVASAMAGETNRLVQLVHDLDPLYRGPAYDMLLASGEQAAIALLAVALEKRGGRAEPLLAHQVGIYTDAVYGRARIREVRTDRLRAAIARGAIPVIAGFQGVTADAQHITILGRGGSDLTAVAIAAALGCESCEIYTDVPAVATADPRVVPAARPIARLSFEEMLEMAALGARVLHPRAVELARKFGVAIHLRSSFTEAAGTWITREDKTVEQPVVSAVTHDAATAVFKLYPVPAGPALPAALFEALGAENIVVDIITQSAEAGAQRLAFSVSEEDAAAAARLLPGLLGTATAIESVRRTAKLSVIGAGMRTHPGVAARFFHVLDELGIATELVTTSDIKISAVIDGSRLHEAARALHTAFGLDAGGEADAV